MTSYEISRKVGMYHSDLLPMIVNLAEEFDSEVAHFDNKGEWFELNTLSAALIILTLGETEED